MGPGRPLSESWDGLGRGVRAVAAVLLLTGAGVYCWWATGRRSFTESSYLAVAIPVLVALGFLGRRLARRPSGQPGEEGSFWPWAVVALAALVLEVVSLVMGGKSRAFPSLSTLVDQLLAWHAARAVMFGLWLSGGALILRPASPKGSLS